MIHISINIIDYLRYQIFYHANTLLYTAVIAQQFLTRNTLAIVLNQIKKKKLFWDAEKII